VSDHLTTWLHHWGYWAVFLGVMAESAGIPFPGETIIITATLMAVRHVLSVEFVWLFAVTGAILGDNIGYWVGRVGGRPLLLRLGKIWRVSESTLDDVERAFQRYGRWAVFFGRFITLLRTWAGPLAGLNRMPWWQFFFFNAIGALVWGSAVVALSTLFGATLVRYIHRLDWIVLLAVGFSIVGFFVFHWLAKRSEKP
jgi:membrane protein DedA with SNARE-associated domain